MFSLPISGEWMQDVYRLLHMHWQQRMLISLLQPPLPLSPVTWGHVIKSIKGIWAETQSATSRPGPGNISCHPPRSLRSCAILMQRIPRKGPKVLEAALGRRLGSLESWKAGPNTQLEYNRSRKWSFYHVKLSASGGYSL